MNSWTSLLSPLSNPESCSEGQPAMMQILLDTLRKHGERQLYMDSDLLTPSRAP